MGGDGGKGGWMWREAEVDRKRGGGGSGRGNGDGGGRVLVAGAAPSYGGNAGRRTLGSSKVDDVPVLLEHVHLLDGLDGLHVEFLERGLQLLVVGPGGLVHLLLFPPWCAFAPGNTTPNQYMLMTSLEDARASTQSSPLEEQLE